MINHGDLRELRSYPDTGHFNVCRYDLPSGKWCPQVTGISTQTKARKEAKRLARSTWGNYNPGEFIPFP